MPFSTSALFSTSVPKESVWSFTTTRNWKRRRNMRHLPWLQTLSAMHYFPPFSVLWQHWHPLSYSNGTDTLCIAVWPKWTCLTTKKSLTMLEIIRWNYRQLNLLIGVFIPFQWLISTFSHNIGMSAFWSIFIGNKSQTLSWLRLWSFSFWNGP